MALITIKRSAGTTGPSSLAYGELAVSVDTSGLATSGNGAGRLFVGNESGTPVVIGGEYVYRLLDHEPSILTPSSAVLVGAAGTIDFWNVVGVTTTDTLRVNDVFVAGTGIGSLNVGLNNEFSVSSAGTITAADIRLTGLSTSSVVITDATGNLITDSAIQFYQTTEVFGGLLDVSSAVSIGGTLTASTATITNLTSTNLTSTNGIINSLNVGIGTAGVRYTLPTTREVAAGQIMVADGNGILGFATNDHRLNFVGNEFSGSVGLGSETFKILGGTNVTTVATGAGNTITINLSDDILVGGALTVTGDFTVNGNISYLSSTITQIEDKNIELAVPEVGSPADSTADGGGITVKGDSDYQIVWSNSRDAFTVNQGWEPLGDNTLSLGSTTVQWKYIFGRNAVFENLNVTGLGTVSDLSISGVGTLTSADINGGSINNTTIGIGTSTIGNFTTLGFLTAFGERVTVTDLRVTGISTVASLAFTSADRNGVAYAGTSNIVGFSSSPSAGISTSTYILTSLGIGTADIPVWTDTIDCGTY